MNATSAKPTPEGANIAPIDPNDALVKSYRYLRVSMVILVIVLFSSILIEWRKTGTNCFQVSISSYYYTPVQPIFVGVLIALGTCLIAVKGAGWEDAALNVAGMLAPIVALVPTTDIGSCMSVKFAGQSTGPGISNNFVALMIGGLAAVIVSFISGKTDVRDKNQYRLDKPAWSGLVVAGAVFLGEFLWYTFQHKHFLHHAHFTAAVAMFAFVGFASALNGCIIKPAWKGPWHWFTYRRTQLAAFYCAVPIAMGVAGIAIAVVGHLLDSTHTVLVLEFTEITIFAAYWLVQTKQHWWDGVARVTASGCPEPMKPSLSETPFVSRRASDGATNDSAGSEAPSE